MGWRRSFSLLSGFSLLSILVTFASPMCYIQYLRCFLRQYALPFSFHGFAHACFSFGLHDLICCLCCCRFCCGSFNSHTLFRQFGFRIVVLFTMIYWLIKYIYHTPTHTRGSNQNIADDRQSKNFGPCRKMWNKDQTFW
jgi:hypothetical protein